MNLKEIRWGILGCGDVCEVKSGPAFNKVPNSSLAAVMRRDKEKARDFAKRHGVPKYYADANALIHDADVNAIYIATPPAFHEQYAIASLQAGKPVYIEKPVALNGPSCIRILETSARLNVKASVAHYRRRLPLFRKIKELVDSGAIGKPGLAIVNTLQAPKPAIFSSGYWRIDPAISGGGLFFDLAPHQLDIFYWLFGQPIDVRGYSLNQKKLYAAPDITNLEALYGNVYVHALWAFNVHPSAEQDTCTVIGDKGKLTFSFFQNTPLTITTTTGTETIAMENPINIQQPMIRDVVNYFLDDGPNPCSLEDALVTMHVMDATHNG